MLLYKPTHFRDSELGSIHLFFFGLCRTEDSFNFHSQGILSEVGRGGREGVLMAAYRGTDTSGQAEAEAEAESWTVSERFVPQSPSLIP